MAEQFEKEGKPTRVTMRLTPSFLIGKFKINVISNQRFDKDKNKLKKKEKLNERLKSMEGWMANDNDDSRPHADVKKTKADLQEVHDQLKAMKDKARQVDYP